MIIQSPKHPHCVSVQKQRANEKKTVLAGCSYKHPNANSPRLLWLRIQSPKKEGESNVNKKRRSQEGPAWADDEENARIERKDRVVEKNADVE